MTAVLREEILGGVRQATGAALLSAGATSLTVGSGQLATWMFTTGNRFAVIINQGSSDEEHVYATGVSGDTLTGLIRGQDGTTDQAHAAGFTVTHGLFAKHIDLANELLSLPTGANQVLVSTAADTWAAASTLAGLTLTAPTIAGFSNAQHDHGDADDGGTLPLLTDAWTSYVPAVTGVTMGNGTVTGRHKTIGKTVHVNVRLTMGTTSSVTGTLGVALPSVPKLNTFQSGTALFKDDSANAYHIGIAVGNYTASPPAEANLLTATTPSVLASATAPFTWATNDFLEFSLTYEVN